jgi:hypothetical protein
VLNETSYLSSFADALQSRIDQIRIEINSGLVHQPIDDSTSTRKNSCSLCEDYHAHKANDLNALSLCNRRPLRSSMSRRSALISLANHNLVAAIPLAE